LKEKAYFEPVASRSAHNALLITTEAQADGSHLAPVTPRLVTPASQACSSFVLPVPSPLCDPTPCSVERSTLTVASVPQSGSPLVPPVLPLRTPASGSLKSSTTFITSVPQTRSPLVLPVPPPLRTPVSSSLEPSAAAITSVPHASNLSVLPAPRPLRIPASGSIEPFALPAADQPAETSVPQNPAPVSPTLSPSSRPSSLESWGEITRAIVSINQNIERQGVLLEEQRALFQQHVQGCDSGLSKPHTDRKETGPFRVKRESNVRSVDHNELMVDP
jgi:hypothetical protein